MVAIRAMAHQWPVALRPLCRPVQMNKSSKFHRLMSYHLLQEHLPATQTVAYAQRTNSRWHLKCSTEEAHAVP